MRIFFFLLLSVSMSIGCVSAPPADGNAVPAGQLTATKDYTAIKAALDNEWAIDNHTHIVYSAHYDKKLFGYMPLAMRHDAPEQLALAKELFGRSFAKH